MAMLVDVYRNDSTELKRRQLPLIIDENLSVSNFLICTKM